MAKQRKGESKHEHDIGKSPELGMQMLLISRRPSWCLTFLVLKMGKRVLHASTVRTADVRLRESVYVKSYEKIRICVGVDGSFI